MMRLAVLLLFLACLLPSARGQGNVFLESYRKGAELRQQEQLQAERLKLERERIEAAQQMFNQALAVEQQRLRAAEQTAKGSVGQQSREDFADRFTREIQNAIPVLLAKYPDLEMYAPEMKRLGAMFVPGDSPQTTGEAYLDGLYTLAKHAPFSTMVGSHGVIAQPLKNSDIVALVQAGIGEDTIVAKIRASRQAFQLDPSDLVELKAAKVGDSLLRAMIDASLQRNQ
jgi:hypothetical protein